MSEQKQLSFDSIVVLGPTATGKTNLAVKIADKFYGEIISADSRQVYKDLNIGTGKDLDEYKIKNKFIPYHLIDIVDPMEEYNVSRFQKDFEKVFNLIKEKNKLPILCGGTGFYIKAILMNFQIPEIKPDKKLRSKLEGYSLASLIQKLDKISPDYKKNNPVDSKRRVIRAIEVKLQSEDKSSNKNSLTPVIKKPLIIGIKYGREIIRERITKRLMERIDNGMVDEVSELMQNDVTEERLFNLGLEYRYISKYLIGEYSREEMIIKLNTAIHQFAKKQMTFFRNMEKNGIKINWISKGNILDVIALINQKNN